MLVSLEEGSSLFWLHVHWFPLKRFHSSSSFFSCAGFSFKGFHLLLFAGAMVSLEDVPPFCFMHVQWSPKEDLLQTTRFINTIKQRSKPANAKEHSVCVS